MRTQIAFHLLASVLCASLSLAQTGGSTFVVNRYGQHLDGNSFSRKDGVFLTGGPGPTCSGPGLADGDYCFEITDPGGTVLLTPDPILERSVRVTGGVFAQYLGTTRAPAHLGPCGALNLRLTPFANTPYPGGEYKIWLTRVENYDPLGSGLFGFQPRLSKSENFKVGSPSPQSIVRGHAFYDHDQNGVWNPALDALEVPIGSWHVEILRNGVLDGVTFTDQDGKYLFIRDRDSSTHTVREIAPGGFVGDGIAGATWVSTTPRSGPVATNAEGVAAPEFGDLRFELSVGAGRPVSFWSLDDDDPGDHGGFAILQAHDPSWRQALTVHNGLPVDLRWPISSVVPSQSIFVPPGSPSHFDFTFDVWEFYANSPSHDHAGFLLSRQIAAAILNNQFGFMQGSILIDRFHNGVLVPFEDMLAGGIGLISEFGAGLTGPNDLYQALRAMMIACTNEFGSINNSGDPGSTQVVYGRSTVPGPLTPYY